MPDDDGIEAMTRACIAAHEAVVAHGSAELQTYSSLLLYTLAREMAEQLKAEAELGGPPRPHPDPLG